MRKASTLIGLTLVALAALGPGARAQDRAPAAPEPAAAVVDPFPVVVTPPPAPRPRLQVGLSFLPMGLGKITTPIGGMPAPGDASLAYGFGLSASYRLIAGLSVGIAPQIIYNVNYKVYPSELMAPPAGKETDLMARLAYTFPIVETIGLYVEVLPGYSLIGLPDGTSAKGFVLGFGGGVDLDLTDRVFANLGVGYQIGYQSVTISGTVLDNRTKYLRVALGGGVKF
jgi:hypothetical protein